jgi:hypothetical protein
MNKLALGLLVGFILVMGWGGVTHRVLAQSGCYTIQQIAQGCSLYGWCMYLYDPQPSNQYAGVYAYGTCTNPHHGHACGSQLDVPSFHFSLGAIFNNAKKGVLCVPPPVGSSDLNNDGKVNAFDYNLMSRNYGKKGAAGFVAADIVQDGGVDMLDRLELVKNYR